MCGIVGYIGCNDAKTILLNGLERLEYRGYDSAGIALVNGLDITIFKDKGRINHLKEIVDNNIKSNIGIGHTRWATHGKVNKINSHPHESNNKRFVLVHNGVIENYKKLKLDYLSDYNFYSETDSEVIVNLIEYYSRKMDTKSSIRKVMSLLEGSYALLILDKEDNNKIYAVKNKTPLLIGVGDGITIASDLIALDKSCEKYFSMPDLRMAIIENNDIALYDMLGFNQDITYKEIKLDDYSISKGEYDHFMLKEINEQADVIRRLISSYFDKSDVLIDSNIINLIKNSDKINFVGCGTSLYASLMGKYFMEKLCGIPSESFQASELVYSNPLITKNPVFIFISQSGETADCISIMKRYKALNYKIITICNQTDSTMANLSDYVIDINAGVEISVASTKAYIAQITTLSILAKAVSDKKTNLKNNLNKVSRIIENIIQEQTPIIKDIAKKIKDAKSLFYIGRGIDYWAAQECSLKLKEISYIHTEAYSSGELKHGTIALIEKNTPVIAIISQEGTNSIVRSNLAEVEARGAKTYVISLESLSLHEDDVIIPNVAHYLTPLVTVIVGQLLAYYVALYKGNDVDKPKNLAKSVTVE